MAHPLHASSFTLRAPGLGDAKNCDTLCPPPGVHEAGDASELKLPLSGWSLTMPRIECFVQHDLFAEPFEGPGLGCRIPNDAALRLALPERLLVDLAASVDAGQDEPILIACRWRDADDQWLGVSYIGLNTDVARDIDLATGETGSASLRFAQLIRTLGETHAGIEASEFDAVLAALKFTRGLVNDIELASDDWEEVVVRYNQIYELHTGVPFPRDPVEQLRQVIELAESSPTCQAECRQSRQTA
jgi:hypothetical protein